MYKSRTLENFKKYFDLPKDYKVDGIFCYDTWREREHKKLLKEIIKE